VSDIISRKWLIEAVEEGWIKFDTKADYNRFIHLVRDVAPSAQPERKKGKWIYGNPATMKCDQCGYYIANWRQKESNFCPCCGAEMEGSTV